MADGTGRRVAAAIAVAAGLAGCQLLGIDLGNDVDHERVWNARSGGSYNYVVDRSCFCYPAGRFEVVVENYSIQSITRTDNGEALDPSTYEYVHTIEQLFDLIDEARRSADKLRVEYADEGYPTVVDIDWIVRAVDDELFYRIHSVTITG